MGSGESTARRIAMQRSEEGVIQISEDVMLRLQGKEKKTESAKESMLNEGELIIQEENLTSLLEEAYNKGRREAAGDIHHELEKIGGRVRSLKGKLNEEVSKSKELVKESELKAQQLQSLIKEKETMEMERQSLQVEMEKMKIHEDMKEKELKDVEEAWRKELQERELHLEEIKEELKNEREVYNQQAKEKEIKLKEEFQQGMDSVKNKLKPVQRIEICHELQDQVLECFRLHRGQSLRCSSEVKGFMKCVEDAQLHVLKSS